MKGFTMQPGLALGVGLLFCASCYSQSTPAPSGTPANETQPASEVAAPVGSAEDTRVDGEELSEETRKLTLKAEFEKALRDFQAEPTDGVWAGEVSSLLEESLQRRLTLPDGVQRTPVECKRSSCSLEIRVPSESPSADGFGGWTLAIQLRLQQDLWKKGHSASTSFVTMYEPSGEAKVRRYYFRFKARMPKSP